MTKYYSFRYAALLSGILIILCAACRTSTAGSGAESADDSSETTPGSKTGIQDGTYHFYVGSGNGELSHPLQLLALDAEGKAFSVLDSFPATGGAGYLALSTDHRFLYTSSGESLPGHEGSASVAAFSIGKDLRLTPLNKQSSEGRGNCHVHVSPDGSHIFAANYSSGHATAIKADENGKLGAITAVVKGEGTGPVTSRQEGPHAHQVMTDPAGQYLLVPDLGTDKVMNYAFDASSGQLKPNPAQPFHAMHPGAGPRHLAFHPNGEELYILSELNATVQACRFNPENGSISAINTASILPENLERKHQSAAVRVHPSGDFIYATNRDDISNISVFRRSENGSISRIQFLDEVAYWPRDFNITPDGKFLILAGARANRLELYAIDQLSGMLTPLEAKVSLPGPICIVFIH